MIELLYCIKRNNGEKKKVHVFLYIIMTSIPVFVTVFIMLAGTEFLRGGGGHYYNDVEIAGVIKMLFISAFFSIMSGVTSLYMDRYKIQKKISLLKRHLSEEKPIERQQFVEDINNDEDFNFTSEIREMIFRCGGLKEIEAKSISFTVKGLNFKKIECRVFCRVFFSLGEVQDIVLNFKTINDGDLKLKEIIFTTEKRF